MAMINTRKMTPAIYSKKSRDYQVFCDLFTTAFNSVKACADDMDFWDKNIDNRLAELRARTLNFVTDHKWDPEGLEAITSIFKYLIRHKGTVGALKSCLNIFAHITGDLGFAYDVQSDDNGKVTIYMTSNMSTNGQIADIMKYILPAGNNYRVEEVTSLTADPLRDWYADFEDPQIVFRNMGEVHKFGQSGSFDSGVYKLDSEVGIKEFLKGRFSQMTVGSSYSGKEEEYDSEWKKHKIIQ